MWPEMLSLITANSEKSNSESGKEVTLIGIEQSYSTTKLQIYNRS